MDRALRGNRLTMGQPSPRTEKKPKRKKSIMTFEEEVNASPNEALGIYVSGGIKGKPHSTKEGRIASGKRKVTRFFYGRKKKGVKV